MTLWLVYPEPAVFLHHLLLCGCSQLPLPSFSTPIFIKPAELRILNLSARIPQTANSLYSAKENNAFLMINKECYFSWQYFTPINDGSGHFPINTAGIMKESGSTALVIFAGFLDNSLISVFCPLLTFYLRGSFTKWRGSGFPTWC